MQCGKIWKVAVSKLYGIQLIVLSSRSNFLPNVPAGLEQLLCNGILSGVPVNLLSLGTCIFAVDILTVPVVVVVVPFTNPAGPLPITPLPTLLSSAIIPLLLLLQKDDSLLRFPGNKNQSKCQELLITCQHVHPSSKYYCTKNKLCEICTINNYWTWFR